MSEVNTRYERDHRFVKRLTGLGVVVAAVLWSVSYETSLASASAGQGVWFTAVSVVTLIGAIISTVGTVIGAGIVLTDEPPLPGANY